MQLLHGEMNAMLSKHIIAASRGISANITASGDRLEVIEGSPLSILVAAQRPMFVGTSEEELDQAGLEQLLEDNSTIYRDENVVVPGMLQHGVEMKALAQQAADNVRRTIRMARGEINPLVREIVEAAETACDGIHANSTIDLPINMLEDHAVYRNGYLAGLLENYTPSRSPFIMIDNAVRKDIMGLSEADALKALTTSSATLTAEVLELFTGNTSALTEGLFEALVIRAGDYDTHLPLFGYLLLKGIAAGNIDTIDVSQYNVNQRTQISQLMAYYAASIRKQLEANVKFEKSKRIVVSYNDYEINVVKSVYLKWLKEGGSTEAVLGYVSSKSSDNATLLLAPERYEGVYKRSKNSSRSNASHASVIEVERTTIQAITDYINEELESPNARADAHSRLKNLRKVFPFHGSKKIDEYVRYMVCQTIAPGSDVYGLLCSMDAYFEANPEATPGEAAVMAVSRMVAEWVAGQVVI